MTPGLLKACGSATHPRGSPTICEYTEPDIGPPFYEGLERVILANQTDQGPCVGCRYLTDHRSFKRFDRFLSTVTLHDFCGCNASCVYCSGSEYHLPVKYQASLPHITLFCNLLQSGLIRPGLTVVGWGGGEPTLLETFEDTVDLLRVNRIRQVINTNGIKSSNAIVRSLILRQSTVRISVDSGTDYGYLKVKRNPHCLAVWESIQRYAQTGGDFILKYIVFSMNHDYDEIENFVSRAQAAGVKRICNSTDARSEYTNRPSAIKELAAAAHLYNLAKEKHMEPYFEGIWTADHIAQIKKLGHCTSQSIRLPVDLGRQIRWRISR